MQLTSKKCCIMKNMTESDGGHNTSIPIVDFEPVGESNVDHSYRCHRMISFQSMAELATSAKLGCQVCIFRYEALQTCIPAKFTIDGSLSFDLGTIRNDDPFQNLYWTNEFNGDHGEFSIQFFTIDSSEGHCTSLYKHLPVSFAGRSITLPSIGCMPPSNTASLSSAKTVTAWLKSCNDHHACRLVQDTLLPKRVVRVSDEHLVLYEPNNEFANYVALSHCWGERGASTIPRTTKDNLSAFKQEILWGSLSRTFQDAILFTRALGLNYIWIDSLCIIQDDTTDWQQESAKMASIYQNAYLTLAATASANSDGGCFTQEGAGDSAPKHTRAVLNHPDGTKSPIYARLSPKHSIEEFPLFERAWAYQERILSPRIVHFAGYEVIWECRTCKECECGQLSPDLDLRLHRPNLEGTDRSTETHQNFNWREIVSQFSRLRLTYPSDLFPSLSGLAKRYRPDWERQYVAGLWKDSLIHDLVWKRYPCGSPFDDYHQSKPWTAPSWSWASAITPGTTIIFHDLKTPIAEIVEVSCTHVGLDPTGELASGFLRLRCKAFTRTFEIVYSRQESPLSRTQFDTSQSQYTVQIAGHNYDDLGIEPHGSWTKLSSALIRQGDNALTKHSAQVVFIGWQADSLELDEILVPSTDEERYQCRMWQCLILIESSQVEGAWERVGMIELGRWVMPDDSTEEKLAKMKENVDLFAEYEQLDWREFLIV